MASAESYGFMAFRPGVRQLVSKDETARKRSTEFREKISKFAVVHTLPLKLLGAEDRGLLTEVVNTMKDAEGKPEYTELYSIIADVFGKVRDPIKAETIGSLLAGCSKSYSNSCNVLCATSIQAPPSMGGAPCEYSVIYCSKKSEFQVTRGTAVRSKAILYVIDLDESAMSLNEYKLLQQHGIEELNFYTTDAAGNTLKSVTDGKFVKITDLIAKCGGDNTNKSCKKEQPCGFRWGWIIFVLLLLLVIGFLIYYFCRSNNNTASYDTPVYYDTPTSTTGLVYA